MPFLSKLHGNINLLLPVAFVLGLYLPGAENASPITIKIILATIIFLSCFKIKFEHFCKNDLLLVGKFWLVRFLILPIIIFWITNYFYPELSPAVLILCLAPAGVSSIAFSSLFGANMIISFLLVTISSFSAPLVYTTFSAFFLKEKLDLDLIGMFIDSSLIIFLPIIFFLILRCNLKLTKTIQKISSNLTAYLISLLLILAVGMQREAFAFGPNLLLEILILLILFITFYLFGFLNLQKKLSDKIALAISSGANNNAFAITIAASFFTATEIRFNVLSELHWFLGVLIFSRIFAKGRNAN